MSPGARLHEALQATLTALEAGDVAAAEVANEAVVEVCATLTANALDAVELDRVRALHARCVVAADRRQEHVVAELLQSATEQRATHAYGSTT